VAKVILADMQGQPRAPFRFKDKGQMATIGRRPRGAAARALSLLGTFAWCMWLLVHIYFLSGFRNRLFVLLHWCWSYLTFSRGSRLIVEKQWHSYAAPAARSLPARAEAQRGRCPAHPLPASGAPLGLQWWEEPTRWLTTDTSSGPSAASQPKLASRLEAGDERPRGPPQRLSWCELRPSRASSILERMDDLEFARQLAAVASDLALEYFRRGVATQLKPDGSPVSEADVEIERRLRQLIGEHRPNDGVLGEELGETGLAGAPLGARSDRRYE
jgi:hypothetical protein